MLTVKIHERYGAYHCQHGKVRASSTSSASAAALRLANKLYGEQGLVMDVRYISACVHEATIAKATEA